MRTESKAWIGGTGVFLKDKRKEESKSKGVEFEIFEIEWRKLGPDKSIL